jgi:hypothetical protein
MSGLSRMSFPIKVFPVSTSHPVGYTMEKKRVRIKLEGMTSGRCSAV